MEEEKCESLTHIMYSRPLLTIEEVYADTKRGGRVPKTRQLMSRKLGDISETETLLSSCGLSNHTEISILTYISYFISKHQSKLRTGDISMTKCSMLFEIGGKEVLVSLKF